MKNEKPKFTPGPLRFGLPNCETCAYGRYCQQPDNMGPGMGDYCRSRFVPQSVCDAAPDLLMALENVLSAVAYNDEPAPPPLVNRGRAQWQKYFAMALNLYTLRTRGGINI